MNELLMRQEVPPMPVQPHIVDVEAAAAAQGIVDIRQAEQNVVSGAETYLQQEAQSDMHAKAAEALSNPAFMREALARLAFARTLPKKDSQVRWSDIKGQYAAHNHEAAIRAAEMNLKNTDEDEDEERR